jgi:NAD(P)-dependent dehydrogenase (short-subunit alcohol dehydrogenase family)
MPPSLELFSLAGKVILLTGGTRNYGRIFCRALAEAGATVAVTSRSVERAEAVAAPLREEGHQVHGLALDQASDDSLEAAVSEIMDRWGRVDVLVNSARYIPQMPSTEIDRAELLRSFDINCVGLVLITRRVAEIMREQGGGSIITIGSIYGLGAQYPFVYSEPERSMLHDYPLQKGGTIVWTKQLAAMYAKDHIRANCLTLGGLSQNAIDDHFLAQYERLCPLGRMARAEDVAGPIVFLASDASAYMTGANLIVDGGWSAW